ncbi:VOC family protein [Cribrihabitans sp. XS_ASV171]
MTTVRTCLWYDGRAEEAAELYCSLLPGSRIEEVKRPGPVASAILVHFTLNGAPFSALNGGGGVAHGPAASIAVTLDSQSEADALYDRLLAEGGSEVQCGWLTDRFGVSWQVIPVGFVEVIFGPNATMNERAYAAMREMKRLDLAALQAASKGE